jgi:hypothetical protein
MGRHLLLIKINVLEVEAHGLILCTAFSPDLSSLTSSFKQLCGSNPHRKLQPSGKGVLQMRADGFFTLLGVPQTGRVSA